MKQRLDPKRVSLQSAFSEPVYERLSLQNGDQEVQLLSFVRPISQELRQYLLTIGAHRSERFEAECFSEVWELSSQWLANPCIALRDLDLYVSRGIKLLDGRYSAAAGRWFCPGANTTADRKHWTSSLLSLSELAHRRHAR